VDKRQIPICGALLAEIRRWDYSPHHGFGLSRWSTWARALLQRHGRIGEGHRPADMTLVRPLVQRLHQQWLFASRQCFPCIHLSIQPILRHTVWRDLTRLSEPRAIYASALGKEIPIQHLNYLMTQDRRFLPSAAISNVVGIPSSAMRKQAGVSEAFRSGEFIDAATVHPPLHLVFQRLRQTDEVMISLRRNALLWESTETQAREVRQRIRRIEQRFVEAVSLIFHKALQGASIETGTSAPMISAVPASNAPSAFGMQANPWMTGALPMPPVNIDQLTDQVVRQLDRRMIAWRERRGRI
jgi:hypothetical protein